MKTNPSHRPNPIKVNLWLDIVLFAAILLALSPALTGIAIHEWLSLALAVAALVHVVLHWDWIVNVLRRFFARLAGQARLNLILNVALFVDFVVVMLSGILISREALPLFGLVLQADRTWEGLHRLSADLSVFIVGLHVALHWKWLATTLQRYVLNPLVALGHRPFSKPVPIAVRVRTEVKR